MHYSTSSLRVSFTLMLALLLFSFGSHAQTGVLSGTVYDEESGEIFPFVTVGLLQHDVVKAGTVTDFDGNFILKGVPVGTYSLKVTYIGYLNEELTDVVIQENDTTNLVVHMEDHAVNLQEVYIEYLIEPHSDAGAPVAVGGRERKHYESKPQRKANGKKAAASALPPSDNRDMTFEAGQLTAGQLNDVSKWELWNDIAESKLTHWRLQWGLYPLHRYEVQLTNAAGWPMIDQAVHLFGEKGGAALWSARTDNTGKAELWIGMFDSEKTSAFNIIVEDSHGNSQEIQSPQLFETGVNQWTLDMDCGASDVVDIAFMVDATGSMEDEISYLKTELLDVLDQVKKKHKSLDINLGSVFYRCVGNSYTTRISPFSRNLKTTAAFIGEQEADEGGTEAVEIALEVALNDLKWSDEARARLLFIVLDEPPGSSPEVIEKLSRLIALAAKKGVRIVPVVASGINGYIDRSLEYLMRSMALATNGTYVFLTDDSGIGGSHTAPVTDAYDVEKLNEILVRIIDQFVFVPKCNPKRTDDVPLLLAIEAMPSDSATSASMKLELFPVPTAGELTVKLTGQASTVYIVDMTGKVLQYHGNVKEGTTLRFDLANYANGTYFVIAEKSGAVVTERVVVQH